MALVGFQCESVNLDVNEVCFDERHEIANQEKVKALLNDVDVGNKE